MKNTIIKLIISLIVLVIFSTLNLFNDTLFGQPRTDDITILGLTYSDIKFSRNKETTFYRRSSNRVVNLKINSLNIRNRVFFDTIFTNKKKSVTIPQSLPSDITAFGFEGNTLFPVSTNKELKISLKNPLILIFRNSVRMRNIFSRVGRTSDFNETKGEFPAGSIVKIEFTSCKMSDNVIEISYEDATRIKFKKIQIQINLQ